MIKKNIFKWLSTAPAILQSYYTRIYKKYTHLMFKSFPAYEGIIKRMVNLTVQTSFFQQLL